MSPEKARDLTFRLLSIVLGRQQQPPGQFRFRPFPLFNLIEWVINAGAEVDYAYGPWRVMHRRLGRPGRYGLDFIPVVKREVSEIMVDTMGQAVRLAGFLNWCSVPELTPASQRP
jgi:hypothetical protein